MNESSLWVFAQKTLTAQRDRDRERFLHLLFSFLFFCTDIFAGLQDDVSCNTFFYDNHSCIWYGVNVEFANTGFECGVAESTNSSSNITKYNAKFYFEPSRSC
jgi:hypothetical protein